MADDRHLGTDIRLELCYSELRPVYRVGLPERCGQTPTAPRCQRDLATVSGRDNLAQAITIRLLTPRGELAALAHPEYGSRLHELIGRQNTGATRGLAKLYILESLAQEPRIEKVLHLAVEPTPGTRDRLDVSLTVQPAGPGGALTIGPLTLELGP